MYTKMEQTNILFIVLTNILFIVLIIISFGLILFMIRNYKIFKIRMKIIEDIKTTKQALIYRTISYNSMLYNFLKSVNKLDKEARIKIFGKK